MNLRINIFLKIVLFLFVFIFASFLFSKNAIAIIPDGCTPGDQNCCLHSNGAPGCCDTEGPNGYNCSGTGGGGATGGCFCGTYDAREDGGGAHACIPHPNPNDCVGAGVPDGCPAGQHLVASTMSVCYGLIDINSLGLTPGAACSQQCRGDECWDNKWWVTIPTSICVPYPSCTTASPSAPTLVSPANGAIVASTTVQLSWNPPTGWVVGCPENNNYYVVHMRPVGGAWSTYYDGITITSVPVNGTNGTTYEWYIEANNGSLSANSLVGSFTIDVPARAWWQVKDSDVATNGDLSSNVASSNFFGLPGTGGFPGVPAYAGSTNLTGSNVSETGWITNSASVGQRAYSYDYFANLIPADITVNSMGQVFDINSGVADSNGYFWYKYDGAVNGNQDLTIPGADIGTRKIILLVDNANLNITGNINLTKGQGFFMVIVKGNINTDSGVGAAGPNLEGLYFADGSFSDSVGATQLHLRGSLATNGGITLQRDLGGAGNDNPAELFEFAPDQLVLFPKVLGTRRINWKEVAP